MEQKYFYSKRCDKKNIITLKLYKKNIREYDNFIENIISTIENYFPSY